VRYLGNLVQRWAEPMSTVCDGLLAPDGCYRRSLLYRTDRFELLLLRWGEGAQSAVHDHARQTCVFTVLKGELDVDDFEVDTARRVRNFVPVAQTNTMTVTPGMCDYRKGDLDVHRVRCPSAAISLHIYAAPIERCGIYSPETSTRLTRRLRYDDIRVDLLA
jgi:cysteine dioxygenase